MKYITRTIKTLIVITKCVDTETLEIVDKTFTIGNVPSKYAEREVNKQLKGTTLKLAKILNTTFEENKYKMTEQEFMTNAEIVD